MVSKSGVSMQLPWGVWPHLANLPMQQGRAWTACRTLFGLLVPCGCREAEEEKWKERKVITSVYVTGLPDDVTEAELAQARLIRLPPHEAACRDEAQIGQAALGRDPQQCDCSCAWSGMLPDKAAPNDMEQVFAKCGILKEDDDGRPRVKIYRDKASGMLKGDGLVSYLKPPSVRAPCPSHASPPSAPKCCWQWSARLGVCILESGRRPTPERPACVSDLTLAAAARIPSAA